MILNLEEIKSIYIVCGKTDLRKGIDGLATYVMEEYNLDVFDKSLFLFCGTQMDRFKALYWQGDGFLLLYKRLENGRIQWPKNKHEVKKIHSKQLLRLLDGLSLEEKKTIHRAKTGAIY